MGGIENFHISAACGTYYIRHDMHVYCIYIYLILPCRARAKHLSSRLADPGQLGSADC